MSVVDAENDKSAWINFADSPLDYIAPERLRDLLGANISANLCSELKNCARLRRRLSGLIASHYELPSLDEEMPDGPDKRIAIIPPSELPVLVFNAGAIFWSSALASAVKRDEVARLQEQLGDGLHHFAIRYRKLGGPKQELEPLETLRQRMSADGLRCYAAWCEVVALGIAARARLKVPPGCLDTSLTDQFKDNGAEILRLAVSFKGA